jgi:hypothetical protein
MATLSFSFLILAAMCGILPWPGGILAVLAGSYSCPLISFWRF